MYYKIENEYDGPNAVPAVTMQVRPSSGGDTVTNTAEYSPGDGAKVVVGYWEHPDGIDYTKENPCAGEPTPKIAYPIDYGSQKCYAWEHWAFSKVGDSIPGDDSKYALHENSASRFSCDEKGDLHFTQWTTMTCRLDVPTANCSTKTISRTLCSRDNPPTIWSKF